MIVLVQESENSVILGRLEKNFKIFNVQKEFGKGYRI